MQGRANAGETDTVTVAFEASESWTDSDGGAR
jgi:hypothetical protein